MASPRSETPEGLPVTLDSRVDSIPVVEPVTPTLSASSGVAFRASDEPRTCDSSDDRIPDNLLWTPPNREVFFGEHSAFLSGLDSGLLGPAFRMDDALANTPRPVLPRSSEPSSIPLEDRMAALECMVVSLTERVRGLRLEIAGIRDGQDEVLAHRVAVHVAQALRSVAERAAGSFDWAESLA